MIVHSRHTSDDRQHLGHHLDWSDLSWSAAAGATTSSFLTSYLLSHLEASRLSARAGHSISKWYKHCCLLPLVLSLSLSRSHVPLRLPFYNPGQAVVNEACRVVIGKQLLCDFCVNSAGFRASFVPIASARQGNYRATFSIDRMVGFVVGITAGKPMQLGRYSKCWEAVKDWDVPGLNKEFSALTMAECWILLVVKMRMQQRRRCRTYEESQIESSYKAVPSSTESAFDFLKKWKTAWFSIWKGEELPWMVSLVRFDRAGARRREWSRPSKTYQKIGPVEHAFRAMLALNKDRKCCKVFSHKHNEQVCQFSCGFSNSRYRLKFIRAR